MAASVIVQHDWEIDVRAQQGKFWISLRTQPGAPMTHGDVFVSAEGLRTNFNASVAHEDGVLTVVSPEVPDRKFQFQCPTQTFSKVLKRKILSCDVSPNEELAVCSGDEGQLHVLNFKAPALNRYLAGHTGDVYTSRFFPSGEVVLSGGADLTLRIWSATDGTCARTLRGHTGGVLGTALIGRGRNFVSCARDGSVRLWDCASASCIRAVLDPPRDGAPVAAVNGVAVLTSAAVAASTVATDEREAGTEGQCVFAACGDGHIRGLDLRSRAQVADVPTGSPVNCVTATEELVVGGCADGSLVYWDQRAGRILRREHLASAAVSSIAAARGRLVVGADDGQCWLLGTAAAQGPVQRVLTGADIDPICAAAVGPTAVYVACRDAAVRQYRVES